MEMILWSLIEGAAICCDGTNYFISFHFISFHFFVRRSELESSKRAARVTEETTATLRRRDASIDSIDKTANERGRNEGENKDK